ncbi:TonB-dependent receptor [Marinilabilia rubra]|uniref:SusC/RagA family TonB-linked outer membrane protein n=1 Tax=Marinilabilia rubra TaxID=2162893 RepID=A0A2U2B5V6_9BACT|nr:TonB-dependent receptor [Marinilabilia rubra]PWD98459.1 SusC/RagA family TonB-linked outer membrane protein [Marinilabilia rubra]
MKNYREWRRNFAGFLPRKLMLIMRLTIGLVLLVSFQAIASGSYAQDARVSLKMKNARVKEVLQEIEKSSEFFFVYNNRLIDVEKEVDVEANSEEIRVILDQIFNEEAVSYTVMGKQIVLSPSEMVIGNLPGVPQEKRVSGTVKDQKGEPIPGVTVMVEGTTNGTITGSDGNFSLDVSEAANELVFSFIGMEPRKIEIGNKDFFNVVMKQQILDLDEVVVVGYGTKKKANLTGSVATVDGEELTKRTVPDTRLALQGATSGVTVIDRGGAPGSEDVSIKIRGNTSLSAGSNPLVLVDGIEMPISEVNPADIESMSILKDAASSAIYGARAANGVVLITTKRGKEGAFTVNYDGHMGWQTPATLPELVGAGDYLNLVNEALENAGQNPKYSEEYIQNTVAGNDPIKYPYTNLFEELFNTAPMQKHSLRISGGKENANIAFSVNYLDQDGMMKNVNSKRYGMRLNTDLSANENLNFRADISFNRRDNKRPSRLGDAISDIVGSSPVLVPKYPSGLYGLNKDNNSALADLEVGGSYEDQYETLNIKTGADFEITPGLKLTSDFSYKSINNRNYTFRAEYKFYDPFDEDRLVTEWYPSDLDDSRWMTRETNFKMLLDYDKSFEGHNVHVLGGYEAIESNSYYLWGSRKNIYSNDYAELNTGDAETKDNSGYREDWALLSYFGRFNYNFKQKYLLEANFRYDGSSRFAKGNKWGFFPSFSAAWRVSKEGFMNELSFVDNLKFRASWGQLGNQNIGLYRFTSPVFSGYDYSFNDKEVSGYSQWYYANTDVTWETTEITDIGFDLTLWNGKFDLVADYFIKDTKDVLMTLPISNMVGLEASESNAGQIRNEGWEISVSHRNKIGEFDYSVGFNMSDIQNEVISLSGKEASISGWTILKEGEPAWALYGYKSDGLFQSEDEINNHPTQPNQSDLKPGDIKLVDLNEDGEINDEDRIIIGNTLPRYTFGGDLYAAYKGFDLSATFQGVLKAENYFYGAPNEGPNFEIFTTTRALDRWTPENPNASFPRLEAASNKNNFLYNDFWVRDASYIRMKNLQIGYTLPGSILEKIKVDRLRLYLGGTNLFTITDVESGLDPETYQGRPSYYPPVSTYILGMQINF